MRATPRSLVVFFWSFVALSPLGVGACHVGDDDPAADGSDDGDDGTVTPDASTDDGDDTSDDTGDDVTDDGADDGGEVVDPSLCRDLVPNPVVAHHPARYDYDQGGELGCNQGGCHGNPAGPAAPVYTIGGTVFREEELGQPVGGATVYVTDQGGKGVSRALVTDENGFFWSTEALTPPFELAVTAGCPDDPIPMRGVPISGNCNGPAGCHTPNLQIFSEPPTATAR